MTVIQKVSNNSRRPQPLIYIIMLYNILYFTVYFISLDVIAEYLYGTKHKKALFSQSKSTLLQQKSLLENEKRQH